MFMCTDYTNTSSSAQSGILKQGRTIASYSCVITLLLYVLHNCLEPKMADINKIIIPRIQAEWEDVAYALHYEIPKVKAIKENNQSLKKCCRELFIDWLSTDHGAGPKTWATLIEKLKEVEDLTAATNEIIDELGKSAQS